jgi:L-alanine-DL-glutamate epimerase-like enolase superfamily enzyme
MYQKMYWSIRNEGFRGPAAALLGQIDLALHDLAARRCQMPLHKYLGATRNKVKFYGSGGGTNYSRAELEKEIMYFMEAGTDCYKMKVGKDFGNNIQADIERVKFVRGLLGSTVKLAVDANQIWTNHQALEFVERCSGFDIAWIEEPVHSAAIDQIQEFCHNTPLQVSFGESERSSLVFPALLQAGVGHFQPVPTHLAGVREWMNVRDLAASNNIALSSGGYSLFTSALVVTGTEDCHVEYLHTLMKGLESYFSVMPVVKGGMFELPDDVAGLPVRVDWNYCERKNKIFRTRTWTSVNTGHYIPVVSV